MADYLNHHPLHYNGVDYMPGTTMLVKTKYKGEVVTTYLGWNSYTKYQFEGLSASDVLVGMDPKYWVIKIIEPVYYHDPPIDEHKKANVFLRTGSGSAAHDDEIFHGLLLYIAVMLCGIIFNERWLIWIVATAIFFGWKAKK
jgi:hypothetical protein